MWHYVTRRPWQFGGIFFLIAAASGCGVAVQYGMKLLVDAMATDDRAGANVWYPLGVFIGLIVLENIFWRLSGWAGCRTVIASCVDLRVDLFRYLTGHPMRYFSENFAGALGNRITATSKAAEGIYGSLAWRIMPPCVDFVGAVLVLFTVHWYMAVALIFFVALVAGIIVGFGIRGRHKHQRYAAQSARVGGELVDVVTNVWTIKAFSAREREAQRLSTEIGIEAKAHRRSWMYLEKARVIHDICLALMAGGMLIWSVVLWRAGSVTPGDVVLVSTLTFRILNGSRELALALVEAVQQLGAISDTLKIVLAPHALDDPEPQITLQEGTIEFNKVAFNYPDGRRVFEQFNLFVPAGQKIGIVGPSGAGKSTLIQLIQRLDDVQGGCVMIDGQDISDVSQDSLRNLLAVVPQEAALFNRTILENIRYGRPDATDEEVVAAARHAYCDTFIRELPKGYETMVGERGVMLSGGQRQRLGIARAFLKNAPILILDEATSALDTHSEAEIQAALNDLMQGRTVLAVAHRLSTLMGFDRIIVMQHGVIVEDDSPGNLLTAGGLFASLWQIQGASFKHEPPRA
ncbi:ABC transporter ATP-binding protein [Pseudomonas matsuisoli]|uniref:ABC transporter ATP-binding protein n=2 Tax=Pseudomonas matsuisoli TaxID=1515666 RepID=A0A917PVN1_9PSED|nr:ABC transporter ATP-binding protein [Pseudomonas matsuisoli]